MLSGHPRGITEWPPDRGLIEPQFNLATTTNNIKC